MLLVYNRLVRLLAQSPSDELLLGRGMLACSEGRTTTLWVDPTERALQEELVRLLDKEALHLHGRELQLRLREPVERRRYVQPSGPAGALRVSR